MASRPAGKSPCLANGRKPGSSRMYRLGLPAAVFRLASFDYKADHRNDARPAPLPIWRAVVRQSRPGCIYWGMRPPFSHRLPWLRRRPSEPLCFTGMHGAHGRAESACPAIFGGREGEGATRAGLPDRSNGLKAPEKARQAKRGICLLREPRHFCRKFGFFYSCAPERDVRNSGQSIAQIRWPEASPDKPHRPTIS